MNGFKVLKKINVLLEALEADETPEAREMIHLLNIYRAAVMTGMVPELRAVLMEFAMRIEAKAKPLIEQLTAENKTLESEMIE